MKILFLGDNDYRRISSAQYHMRCALEKITDMVHYGPMFPSYIEHKRVMDVPTLEEIYKPDVILIQGFRGVDRWKNLNKTLAPKAVFFSNPHEDPQMRARQINQAEIGMTLHHVKGWIHIYKPLFIPSHKMRWVPFCINSAVFKDYGFERIYDVAILGAMNPKFYPLRWLIANTLVNRKDLKVFHRLRPGGGYVPDPNKAFMRANYAKAIARCKMMIFCTGKTQSITEPGVYVGKYPVQKFYESMACRTLTLADAPIDAEELHFKPGYNFVEINEKNFVNKIYYYIKHEEERKRIINNGYDTVMKYHTCEIRAKQILHYLEELLEGCLIKYQ